MLEAVSVKSGEEWVKSQEKLFTPRNTDKHRGSEEKVKSEEFFNVRYFYRFSFGFW